MDDGRDIRPGMVGLLQWEGHHEEGLSHQKAFQKHICSLVDTITSMGNPFFEDCPELVVMDTRDCVENSVEAMVRTIEERERAQYEKFVHQRAD